ncbi:MAG: MotA/TolQ/ExbB proton channel family protein [Candidatus Riflebacteria bacterium]|nr:MotA/TolQ/ExbB proton channel family protein [Candidatus Riflebacteria bacterium]
MDSITSYIVSMWQSFLSFLDAGGVIMYILTCIGIIICFFGIYQLVWLSRLSMDPKKFSNHGVHLWAKKALNMAASKKGLDGLSLMDSLEVCFARMESSMTWRVPEIRFLAQISTLIGFLGTVTGMVKVFNTVAKLGKVLPGDLAGGIHEALFTTVYGLVLALIAWFFAHCIEMLVNKHMRSLEVLIFSELENSEEKKQN